MRGLNAEAERMLKERYADCGNAELAKELGVSERTVLRWASRLGLRKSEKRLAEVLWNAHLQVAYLRLIGKKVGGGKASAGSFRKGHRWDAATEEKRIEALRERGMDERRRIRNGDVRKTRWRMDESIAKKEKK